MQGLALVARAVSSRTAIQILSGILLEANGGAASAGRDRHGAFAARRRDGAGRGRRARWCCPAARSSTSRGCCRRDDVTIEHARRSRSFTSTPAPRATRLHTYNAEDFPRLPELEAVDVHGRPRGAARDDRPCRARGFARRGAPGADRHPRPVRRRQARDGRDRLVSPRRQGDARSTGAAARARGDRPGPRAAGAGAHRRRRRRDRSSACTRTRSSSAIDGVWLTTRRIDGQFPNYRQLLPEQFEHELHAAARRAARRRAARVA